MNLSRPFILRPVATALLMVALLVSGVIAYRMLPVAALPQADRALIPGLYTLPGQTYQIDLLDEAGAPAQTSAAPAGNTNPVIVAVTTRWTGPGGITYAVQVRSAVTDR